MTDDLVARLRKERDALHAGLSAIIHCQSALRRSEMREAAAGLLDKVGLKPMWFDGDQSPFVRRALAAEARVRELEAEVDAIRHDLERQMTIANVECNRAERALAEAYERAANVADQAMLSFTDLTENKKVSASESALETAIICAKAAREIADAIRNLAQEVKHEAE